MSSRRDFLARSAAALSAGLFASGLAPKLRAAGSSLAARADTRGRLAWPHPIGLQIYTVRREYAADPLRALEQVAAIGYRQVELIDMTAIPPATLNRYLRTAGLTAISGHFNFPKPGPEWDKSVEIAQALNLRYMVNSFVTGQSVEGWKRMAETFNRAGEACHKAGMMFAFHNHIFEFVPVGGTTGYAILMANTDPNLVGAELDIFWAEYAKQNPLDLFRRYPGRFPMLHIKDRVRDLSGWNPAQFPAQGAEPFAPVGEGAIAWRPIFAHTREAGAKYIFVEQDRAQGSPMAAARASYEYLHTLRLS